MARKHKPEEIIGNCRDLARPKGHDSILPGSPNGQGHRTSASGGRLQAAGLRRYNQAHQPLVPRLDHPEDAHRCPLRRSGWITL